MPACVVLLLYHFVYEAQRIIRKVNIFIFTFIVWGHMTSRMYISHMQEVLCCHVCLCERPLQVFCLCFALTHFVLAT